MSYDFWEKPAPQGSRFALRLRQMRSAAGLTAVDLARRANVDPADYMACEAGRRRVSAAMLMRLADALKLSADLFFEPD